MSAGWSRTTLLERRLNSKLLFSDYILWHNSHIATTLPREWIMIMQTRGRLGRQDVTGPGDEFLSHIDLVFMRVYV